MFKLMETPTLGGGFGQMPPPQFQPPIEPTAGIYRSPGGFYQLTPADGWILWEEQMTARGDIIEPCMAFSPGKVNR